MVNFEYDVEDSFDYLLDELLRQGAKLAFEPNLLAHHTLSLKLSESVNVAFDLISLGAVAINTASTDYFFLDFKKDFLDSN